MKGFFLIVLAVVCVLSFFFVLFATLASCLRARTNFVAKSPDMWCFPDWSCDGGTTLKPTELQNYYKACNDSSGAKISINSKTGKLCSCDGNTDTTICSDEIAACYKIPQDNGSVFDSSACSITSGLYSHNALFF